MLPTSDGAEPCFAPSERAPRVRIAVNLAFEVLDEEVVLVAADHIVGPHEDLAPAARRIDDEHRRRVAGGVSAQGVDDRQPGIDAGAEMTRAFDRVALVK